MVVCWGTPVEFEQFMRVFLQQNGQKLAHYCVFVIASQDKHISSLKKQRFKNQFQYHWEYLTRASTKRLEVTICKGHYIRTDEPKILHFYWLTQDKQSKQSHGGARTRHCQQQQQQQHVVGHVAVRGL
jgi:hypothetical protein